MKIFFSLLFSLSFYFLNLYLNFSFTFLGFDLKTITNQRELIEQYVKFSIKPSIKIFWIYFILSYFILQLLFFYKDKLKKRDFIFTLFYIFLLLFTLFSHSVVCFPQLYADSFYNKYSLFLPYLHFLTYTTKPYYFYVCLALIILFPIIWNFFLLNQSKDKDKVYFSLVISFFIIHQISNLFLISLYFVFLLIFSSRKIQSMEFYTKRNLIISIIIFVTSVTFLFLSDIFTFSKNIISSFSSPYSKPNIVLISADSLRVDRINEKIMPNLTKFLREKNVYNFKDHHTTIARTFPSWADLLTGKYGMQHKIRHMFPSEKNKKIINSKQIETLPNLLSKNGYHTAVISSFAGDIFPRIDFGYKEIKTPTLNVDTLITQKLLQTQIFLLPILTGSFFGGGNYINEIRGLAELGTDKYILEDTFQFLSRNKHNSFFLTFFSSVAHFPYTPPYPFYKKFSLENYYGKYKYHKFIDTTNEEKLLELDKSQILNLYNSAVYAFDDTFGKILSRLKRMDSYDNTLLIITSDHGEALFESNHLQGHGDHLRGENVGRIPLIIKLPTEFSQDKNFIKKETEDVTSSIDVFPTILEILNLPVPENLDGNSVLSSLENSIERTAYSETGIWFLEESKAFYQKNRILYPSVFKMQTIQNNEIQINDPDYEETISIAKHRMMLNRDFKLIYMPTKDESLYYCYDRKKDPLNDNPIELKFCNTLFEDLKKLLIEKEKMVELDGYFLPKSIL